MIRPSEVECVAIQEKPAGPKEMQADQPTEFETKTPGID